MRGHQHTILGERGELSWNTVIRDIKTPDLGILPTEEVMTAPGTFTRVPSLKGLTIAQIEDYSDADCEIAEISALAIPQLLRAVHIERAAAVWNTAHALELVRDFTETQGIAVPSDKWFDYRGILSSNTCSVLDEKETYPEISEAFSRVTSYLKVNRPSWDCISLALQAASTLERVRQTRAALAITRQAIRDESARIGAS